MDTGEEMRRNPLFIFRDLDSTGIWEVPLKSTVQIVNIGFDDNNMPVPMFIQLVAKDGLSETSTIEELLSFPEDYIDLFTVGETFSQLELITEEGNSGWRILDREPNNYSRIGNGAFDFSFSRYASQQMGASGDYSAAWGQDTIATGDYSTASGNSTTAGYENQFVVGAFNYNKEINAFEVGVGIPLASENAFEVSKEGVVSAPKMETTQITSPRTLITKEYLDSSSNDGSGGQLRGVSAGGNSGYRIFGREIDYYNGIGEQAIDLSSSNTYGDSGAMGPYSFAAGLNVLQANYAGAALGYNNDNKVDTVFEVGNGTNSKPSNALEIYKDGSIIAPSLEVTNIIDPKSLVTKEYVQGVSVGYMIVDSTISSTPQLNYGIPNAVDTSTEVFVNGILLRPGRDYTIQPVISPPGANVKFDKNYTLFPNDWLRIKFPTIQ